MTPKEREDERAKTWTQPGAIVPVTPESVRILVNALRAALAQPEPPCKTGSQCVGGKCERCAVQEPWGYISHRSWKMPVFVEADDLEVSGLPFNNPDYTPVYKAPPQREWVGLTDEELSPIYAEYKSPRNIYLAIESALREKNT